MKLIFHHGCKVVKRRFDNTITACMHLIKAWEQKQRKTLFVVIRTIGIIRLILNQGAFVSQTDC